MRLYGLIAVVATAFVLNVSCSKIEQEDVPKPQNPVNLIVPDHIGGTRIITGNNLAGVVTDSKTGKPISGVAVSDGFSVVQTDENGVYQMTVSDDARVAYISVPSAYELPLDEYHRPAFFSRKKLYPSGFNRIDFSLTPRNFIPEDVSFILAADSHLARQSDLPRLKRYAIPDLIETADRCETPVVALIAGDIVTNATEMFRDVDIALSDLRLSDGSYLPVFTCFGNHDYANGFGDDDVAASQDYVDTFGPLDYSFNFGKTHVIVMNNIILTGDNASSSAPGASVQYSSGLSDAQLAWLAADVAAVQNPADMAVLLCVHAPITSSTKNAFKSVRTELRKFYSAQIVSGHSHKLVNYEHSSTKCVGGQNIYEHNVPQFAGIWWNASITQGGIPMGYKISHVRGKSFYRADYKATMYDEEEQMTIYSGNDSYNASSSLVAGLTPLTDYTFSWLTSYDEDGGAYYTADVFRGKYIVKVWNASDEWSVEYVDAAGNRTQMERLDEGYYDPCAMSFHRNYFNCVGGGFSKYAASQMTHSCSRYWVFDSPSGDPAKDKGWKVVATRTVDGLGYEYSSDVLRRGFDGFFGF